MINLPLKVLIGVGSAGVVGLGGYGIYSAASSSMKTIEQLLMEQKVTLLSFDENADGSKWDAKVTEIEGESASPKLEGFEKSTNSDSAEKKKENKKNLQDICKKLLKSDSSNVSKLEQAKKWCADSSTVTG